MESLLKATKDLCRFYNIKPISSRGQNFLIKKDVYSRIIRAGELSPEDTVLEVGPGLGFLTFELAKRVRRVTAIELDRKLAAALEDRVKSGSYKNIGIINKDILSLDPRKDIKGAGEYKIVANLPYNITSIFLRRFLSEVKAPRSMTLMLQKEVAERILTDPPASILAVMVNFYSDPQFVGTVNRTCFWPQPRVDSAIVHLQVKESIPELDEDGFFKLVRAGYSSRRKMLKNNLSAVFNISGHDVLEIMSEASIPSTARAQDLSVNNWIDLFGAFEKNVI
jgi:16S rRNA (adenine1518-N6/adenine1519-N6)-dimethyltransferase